jgi:acyl-CoA thioesterase-1
MIPKINIPHSSTLLMFRYFILVILLFSCGNESSKSSNQASQETTQEESNIEETNASKTIVFFGDSLTAGYGLDDSNDAYPSLIQSKIDSLNLNYTVVNSGVSGETTSGGRSRIGWVLNQQVDVFVLELGANDGLRGITLSETRQNLQAIIDSVKQKFPESTIILAGMQLPPNLGQDYTTEFRNIFNELTTENSLAIIPFLLKDVGGIPGLNLEDGIHPNEEGQKVVANNVWEVLSEFVK